MNRKLAVLLILLLGIQAAYITLLEMPLVPDVYERLRVSSWIISKHAIPQTDDSFATGQIEFIYPPFADILLSQSVIFSFLNPEISWKFLTFLFFVIFLSGMYFFGKEFLKENELAVMAILCALAPIIVRRYATFVSESFALALVPWVFYLLLKKRNFFAGFLIAAVALIHFRTFGMVLLIIFLLLIYYLTRKNLQNAKLIAKTLISAIIIAAPWYILNFFKILSLSGHENPHIHETIWLPLTFIGLPLIVFAAIFFILRAKRRIPDEIWFLTAIPLLVIGGLFFKIGLPFPYRAAVFLVIPFSMFGAVSFVKLFEQKKFTKILAVILLALCIAFSWPFGSSPYTKNQMRAADFIIEKYGSGTAVLADYEMSYLLSYKGALVYVGSYMERFSDASGRLKLVDDFIRGINDNALQIWKPECILLRQSLGRVPPAGYKELYSNPEAKVFCYLG